MEFFAEYSLFLLKTVTLVIAILVVTAGVVALRRKPKPKLEITMLNEEYYRCRAELNKEIGHKKEDRKKIKQEKKAIKKLPYLYVLKFDGDISASQVEQLRETITAVLSIIDTKDEVLIKLESPGGLVSSYGLAASQLQRMRDRNIPLTVCIDKIAASGGYLMACVANQIVAAPFAIIGSIGVVAEFPNFHRLLKKNDVDIELITAGEYKRTLTRFAENTEKGRKKFQEDLEKIHLAFRDHVASNRKQLDITQVATGEHWLARDAFDLKLVDALKTSDDIILDKMRDFNVVQIDLSSKEPLMNRLTKPFFSKILSVFSGKFSNLGLY